MNKRLVIACLVVVFILGGCMGDKPTATSLPTEMPTVEPTVEPTSPAPTVPAITEQEAVKFADYLARSVTLPQEFKGGYTLPIDLSTVSNINDFPLTAAQKAALSKNGFVVVKPGSGKNGYRYEEFYQLYEMMRYNDTPVFITTDSVFHVYHLIFDKMLRDLEREEFIPVLENLTRLMVGASLEQYSALKGTSLETAALRNLAFFGVGAKLLKFDITLPEEAASLVQAETSLILEHSQTTISPIWEDTSADADDQLIEDYSQYIPRGHYTRSETLERYFRTMMWYGRMTYRLNSPLETQRALLATQALRTAQNSEPAVELWKQIYDPTVFIVGKADDLSFYDYGALSDEVFGASPALTDFGDTALLANFMEKAKTLPPPKINSMWVWIWQDKETVTKGFRFMGQRYTLDEDVFGQLMYRKVGTDLKPRDLPKAMDLLSAMGSAEAGQILDEMGETEYLNYNEQMAKVRSAIQQLDTDSWTQNVYWSWLYSFQPLLEPKDQRFPAFMQTQAWTRKNLHTALASYTELKHDTILYAKQVMAEMGGGAQDEPPHGYVEPDPEVFARLYALAVMTQDGLAARGLLSETTQGNLSNLIDQLGFLQQIAEKELNGTVITDDEYWRLKFYGGWLEALTIAAADQEENMIRGYLEDQKSPLVADIATGIGRVLEEAVGDPTRIYVILPDQPYRIGSGAVYSYYEFTVAPSERMTDKDWQELVYSNQLPQAPEWTNLFIAQ